MFTLLFEQVSTSWMSTRNECLNKKYLRKKVSENWLFLLGSYMRTEYRDLLLLPVKLGI